MAPASEWTERNSRWADRLKLPMAFDPAPLAAEADSFPTDAWVSHYVPDNYEGDWSVLPLRAPAGAEHPLRMIYADPGAEAFEDTPFLAAAPNLRSVLAAFRCPLRTARLMRLGPASHIREHCDGDLFAENGLARLHVPITTNSNVDFRLNGSSVAMAPGSVWYLRLDDPHSVSNRGARARVHLVVDAVVNEWLEAMLSAGE